MFEKELLIDGKGHMMGRLASVCAHELLRGQRIVIVRAD
jgi:large subunit ribosomal protein L13Ae